jgi:hypothetical protein
MRMPSLTAETSEASGSASGCDLSDGLAELSRWRATGLQADDDGVRLGNDYERVGSRERKGTDRSPVVTRSRTRMRK